MYENSLSKYKGKFAGIRETGLLTKHGNSAGLDYLVELGITHIQLLPIYDLRLSMKITRKYYIIGDMIQLSIMFLKEVIVQILMMVTAGSLSVNR